MRKQRQNLRFEHFEKFPLKFILSSGWECNSVAECLSNMQKTLGSVLSTAKNTFIYFHTINITKENFALQIKKTFKKVFNMVFALH